VVKTTYSAGFHSFKYGYFYCFLILCSRMEVQTVNAALSMPSTETIKATKSLVTKIVRNNRNKQPSKTTTEKNIKNLCIYISSKYKLNRIIVHLFDVSFGQFGRRTVRTKR